MSEKNNNSGSDEAIYCGRCKADGKDTLLFYSTPSKPTDTWSRRLANKKDYRCKEHIRIDNKIYSRSKKNKLFKEYKDKIQEYSHKKILEFERIWNAETVSGYPEPRRLMECLRINNIRGQQDKEGFTAEEMVEIIRASEIDFSVSAFVEEWDKSNSGIITRYVRDMVKPEIIKALIPFEADIKVGNRKRVINSIRGLIEAANVLYRNEDVFEKIVTTPGHRDPIGNISHRFHLLTYERTLELRLEKKRRQIDSITSTMEREELVQQKVAQTLQEQENNTNNASNV